jgi:serine protease Do
MKNFFFEIIFLGFIAFNNFSCSAKTDSEQAAEPTVPAGSAGTESSGQLQVAVDPIANSRRNAITQAVELVSPAVVGINVTQIREVVRRNPFFDDPFLDHFFGGYRYRQKVSSLGSGVIISPDGYILTNEHVVHNATEILVTLTGGTKYQAKIVGADVTTDIALLKVDEKELPAVRLGNSDDVIIGEWAIAFGNPFGLFDVGAEPSVSVGVISATNRDFERQDTRVYQDMIQTDAAINSGNSGGPLVNSDGEVIGINTFIFSGSSEVGTSIGLGFAIPVNRVKRIVRELKEHGEVNRSIRTGLVVSRISQLHARSLRLSTTDGVIIADIEKDSPAEHAGLEIGDIILKVNDATIRSGEEILDVIRKTDAKGGDVLNLAVIRNRNLMDIRLRIESIQ